MKRSEQTRALRFGLVSLLVGIALIPLWVLLLWLAADTDSGIVKALFLYGLPAVSAAGLALGVIGLIGSVRKTTRNKKGIAFAAIGIALNLAAAELCVWVLWAYFFVHAVELA